MAGSVGVDFTPHEITVCPGESVVHTIESLARDRRQTIYVLSGTGSITNISLKRDGGRSFISQGEYKILSLSGEFIPISFEGTGYIMEFFLEATLEAADGTEIKDHFSVMEAVSPVQVVVGSSMTSTSA